MHHVVRRDVSRCSGTVLFSTSWSCLTQSISTLSSHCACPCKGSKASAAGSGLVSNYPEEVSSKGSNSEDMDRDGTSQPHAVQEGARCVARIADDVPFTVYSLHP